MKKTLDCFNRVQYSGSTLKPIGVVFDRKLSAMASPISVPVEFKSPIATHHALENDKNLFTFDHISSFSLQERHRKEIRNENTTKTALIAAPQTQQLSRISLVGSHCKQGEHRKFTC